MVVPRRVALKLLGPEHEAEAAVSRGRAVADGDGELVDGLEDLPGGPHRVDVVHVAPCAAASAQQTAVERDQLRVDAHAEGGRRFDRALPDPSRRVAGVAVDAAKEARAVADHVMRSLSQARPNHLAM